MSLPWPRLLTIAQIEVAATVNSLPPPVRVKAQRLPVTYERLPNAALQRDGIADDTMGLFVGEAFPDSAGGIGPLPAQIILFLENIWDEAGQDEEIYREEVRTTLVHELGHYLGLGEDDLDERGLA